VWWRLLRWYVLGLDIGPGGLGAWGPGGLGAWEPGGLGAWGPGGLGAWTWAWGPGSFCLGSLGSGSESQASNCFASIGGQ
jgi:hypothetical protein